jgi:hypothetical protein
MPRHKFCYNKPIILATPNVADQLLPCIPGMSTYHFDTSKIAQALSFGHNARSLNYNTICAWLWLIGNGAGSAMTVTCAK